MGRDVGGGIGMENTCKSLNDSCQCMAKPLQYCKVLSLQHINEKKKATWFYLLFKFDFIDKKIIFFVVYICGVWVLKVSF